MWHLHDAPTSGHMGIQRTILRAVNSSYYWPGMKQFVRDYVKSCDICEERKHPGRKKRNYMQHYIAGGRFERVAADIAGPFPKTKATMYLSSLFQITFQIHGNIPDSKHGGKDHSECCLQRIDKTIWLPIRVP